MMKCKSKTALALTAFAIASAMLSACSPATSLTATNTAICDAWADTLFLPSRQDTQETAVGLARAERVHAAACAEKL